MHREHGVYTLETLPNNILVTDAIGPWNLELVQQYHNEVVKIVEGFNGAQWHNVAILRSETLFIPEVADYLKVQSQWRESSNVVSETVILKDSMSRFTSQEQIRVLFKGSPVPLFFAESIDEAVENLHQLDRQTIFSRNNKSTFN